MEQYEKIYLYKRVVAAKLFIDKHFADAIDLENIAEQACFSKFHFIRLFKSIYGFTPKNYLIKVRMDYAKIFLTQGHAVAATSIMVGLESPTSFAKMFGKINGESPSAFQKRETAKREAIQLQPLHFIPNCFASSQGWSE